MTDQEFKKFVEESLETRIYSDKLYDIRYDFKSLCLEYQKDDLFIYTKEEYLELLEDVFSDLEDEDELEKLEKEKERASDCKVVITNLALNCPRYLS